MSIPVDLTPPAGGVRTAAINKFVESKTLEEDVAVTAGVAQVELQSKLPARYKIIGAQLVGVTANTVTGNSASGTADAIALVTLPATSLTTNATTGLLVTLDDLTANARDAAWAASTFESTATTESSIYIVPSSPGDTRRFDATSYTFNSTGTVRVRVAYLEQNTQI